MQSWWKRTGAWLHDFFEHRDGFAVLAAFFVLTFFGGVIYSIATRDPVLAQVP